MQHWTPSLEMSCTLVSSTGAITQTPCGTVTMGKSLAISNAKAWLSDSLNTRTPFWYAFYSIMYSIIFCITSACRVVIRLQISLLFRTTFGLHSSLVMWQRLPMWLPPMLAKLFGTINRSMAILPGSVWALDTPTTVWSHPHKPRRPWSPALRLG